MEPGLGEVGEFGDGASLEGLVLLLMIVGGVWVALRVVTWVITKTKDMKDPKK